MECSEIRTILLQNAGDDLPPELRERVKNHLAVCSGCARQAEIIEAQAACLNSLPRMQAPAGFLEQVRERLYAPPLWRRILRSIRDLLKPRYALRFAGTATAAVVVLVTVRYGLDLGDVKKANLLPPSPAVEAPAPKSAPGPAQESTQEPARADAELPKPKEPPAAPDYPAEAMARRAEMPMGVAGGKAAPAGRPSIPPQSAATLTAREGAKSSAPIEITLRLFDRPPARGAGISPAPDAATSADFPGRHAEKRATKSAIAPREKFSAAPPAPPRDSASKLSDIESVIIRANGKILSPASPGADGDYRTILAEIPAESFAFVRRELSELGKLAPGTIEQIDSPPGTPIRLRLRLIPARPQNN
ncbi:MAG: hypothetical protein LLG06_02425 [Desulfobacteraceae bacterium]|nr:hypothetical protein [Desulfobacteraceae bacterium]